MVTHAPAYNVKRKNWVGAEIQASEEYQVSQRKRKYIERWFGWLKTIAGLRKTRHRGLVTVRWVFTFTVTAYNLVRMRNLMAPVVQSV